MPTLPQVTSHPPSLLELDSESHHSFREALQGENVPFPSDVSSHLDSDRSHRTASQNFRSQSWSMPPDVLSREMEENAQNVRVLESVHPVNHPNVQKQLPDDSTPERQSSNQTRERTVEHADEPPTQRPRLENPASSIGSFVGQGLMIQDTGFPPQLWKMKKTCGLIWILRCCGSSKSTITSGRTMGSLLVCAKKSGTSFSAIPVKTSRHKCVFVGLKFTGLTATRMTRGDELLRHMIPESEWPRFLQATVTEWAAILETSAVTIISPVAAKDASICQNRSFETCP